jgi:hypothetical protein
MRSASVPMCAPILAQRASSCAVVRGVFAGLSSSGIR